jgi:3-dehydroquinate synthetase
MVDAGLGGKTAIDLPAGKNLAGLFAPPASVLIDPVWLLTLPPRELANGLAELIKTAALKSPAALAAVERDLPRLLDGDTAALTRQIAMAASYKLALCARDPRESGPRLWLNLGHTIAHQIEKELRYDRLTHGEAVAIGLCEELRLAVWLRVIPSRDGAALRHRLEKILGAAGLPVSLREAGLRGAADDWMRRALASDKKTIGGDLRWPLLRAPGQPFIGRYPVKRTEKN